MQARSPCTKFRQQALAAAETVHIAITGGSEHHRCQRQRRERTVRATSTWMTLKPVLAPPVTVGRALRAPSMTSCRRVTSARMMPRVSVSAATKCSRLGRSASHRPSASAAYKWDMTHVTVREAI